MYLKILNINIRNRFQKDTAYFFENWSNFLSTIFYIFVQIALVEVIFSNIDSIGAFTKNDMFLLLFMGQVSYYLMGALSMQPNIELTRSVNTGTFDFVLTKPAPTLWYVLTRNISIVSTVRDGFAPMLAISLFIDWGQLGLTWQSLLAGVGVFATMIVIDYCVMLWAALTVFWTGSEMLALQIFWASRGDDRMPYEPISKYIKAGLFVVSPAIITTGLTSSVLIGVSPAISSLLIVVSVAILFSVFTRFLWTKALLHYSSASS